MKGSDKSNDPPPDQPDSETPYKIGYRRPPGSHCFKPGQSGNPSGKRKPRNDDAMSIEKMKEIVLKEAYRPVKLRIGDKTITLPKIQAAARTHFLNAAEDDMKAFMAALRLVLNFESEKAEDQLKVFASALEYKSNMEKELARRKREGITAPDPVTHPDDIIINLCTGSVETRGPIDERDKSELEDIRRCHDGMKKELQACEKELASTRSRKRKAALEAVITRITPRLKLFADVIDKFYFGRRNTR